MRAHEWTFVRVLPCGSTNQLVEVCWRCGIVTTTDADGTFRFSKNGQTVPEDCDEVIVREVQSI